MADSEILEFDENEEEEVEVEIEVTEAAEEGAQVSKRSGVVTLQGYSADSGMVGDFDFEVVLSSVSDREYLFDNAGDCLKWITRRIYNGEAVSDEVTTLHEVLMGRRRMNTARNAAIRLRDALQEADPRSTGARTDLSKAARNIGKALSEHDSPGWDSYVGELESLVQVIKWALNPEEGAPSWYDGDEPPAITADRGEPASEEEEAEDSGSAAYIEQRTAQRQWFFNYVASVADDLAMQTATLGDALGS